MSFSTPDGFDKAIAELQAKLDNCEVSVKRAEGGTSPLLIMAGLVPVVLFIMLYLLNPDFVTSMDSEGKKMRDKKKVFLWTLGMTLLLWGGLYLYAQATHLIP